MEMCSLEPLHGAGRICPGVPSPSLPRAREALPQFWSTSSSPHPCLLLQNFPEQQPPQQQWPRLGCPPWASPWCPAWGASWSRTTSAGRGSAGMPACRSPRGTRPAGRWAPSGAPSTQPWGRWAVPSSPSQGLGAELLLHVLLRQQAFSGAGTFSSRASREGRAGWLAPWLAPWLFSQLQGEAGSVCQVQTWAASKTNSGSNSNNSLSYRC